MTAKVARRREPAQVAAALEAWLRARPGYADAHVVDLARPAGAGLSNETWLFDCVQAAQRESLVLQVGPAGAGLFRDYDLGVMARVQDQIRRVSDRVPIAPVRWYEPDASVLDAPFYVMARVAGRVPTDNPSYHSSGWFAEAAPELQRAAWLNGIAALAELHRLDVARDGFAFLADAPWGMALDADPVTARLAQWRDFVDWGARRPVGPIDDGLAELARTRPRNPLPLAICWGDAKISNCVLDGADVRALLDWELCGLSDPHEDLAFWLLLDWGQWHGLKVTRLPHLPSARATVEHYEACAGRAMPDVLWWFRFGMVRLAMFYHRFLERRIDAGRMAADADLVAANPMCPLIYEALNLDQLP